MFSRTLCWLCHADLATHYNFTHFASDLVSSPSLYYLGSDQPHAVREPGSVTAPPTVSPGLISALLVHSQQGGPNCFAKWSVPAGPLNTRRQPSSFS